MTSNHQRIPIHSAPWNDDEKPSFNDLSNRIQKTLSRYSRFWSPRPNPITSSPTLPVPASSLKFVLLCSLWYTSSALSSNTGKAILMQFKFPVTLTFVQFGFVAGYCLLLMSPAVRFSQLRHPTRAILRNALPMGMFQVGGHIFSSLAISRIPVSTVHTIKALSPLFTVAAYALLFGVSYSSKTYVSLLPLTVGVMLACSFDMSASNVVGLLCAFGSALVFVSSNIFFKRIMPSNRSGMSQPASHKLDKLNLLLYSSGMAFLLMIPIWLYCDLPRLLSRSTSASAAAAAAASGAEPPAHSVAYYFFMNGTVHFAQNIIAFVILASTSPVTYSIASLIKRVWVICIAIAWFSQPIHPVQGLGILMTFTGLWMYNSAKADVERGEKQMRRVEAARDLALPATKVDAQVMAGTESSPLPIAESTGTGTATAAALHGRPRAPSSGGHHHHHHHVPPPPYVPAQPPHRHTQQPPLKIRVAPSGVPVSPTDSYPSPPPSIDSPRSRSPPLYAHAHEHRDMLVDARRVSAAA
ncbi:triose-phosphate transporter family-domain-containing protein [Mycena pura]|uniref:Triose-phosphate transporter family-domain-containing protein n=1 Tax=Mycena pura TaxID=153505 RepID=A0AAD6YN20_9AGAR|nr:triose-phosphate transporter family-domain-containing protein [Mycena pura]